MIRNLFIFNFVGVSKNKKNGDEEDENAVGKDVEEHVEHDQQKSDIKEESDEELVPEPESTIFVKNLNFSTEEEILKNVSYF